MTSPIQIVDFCEAHAEAFASLNYRWIAEYFSIERHDREILDNPLTEVIEPGGAVFMAVDAVLPVGTVAMIPAGDGVFELTKMAVDPGHQGRGIANLLMQRCLDFAKERSAQSVFLESHRSLQPALALYRKFGFVEVPTDPNSEYARADIRMEWHPAA